MDVGIGLPNTVPGTTGDQLTEWARRADRAGFSTWGRSTGSPTRTSSHSSRSPPRPR